MGQIRLFSLDENEFKSMVDAVRSAEKALGKIDYTLTEKQLTSRNFSRSLYVTEDIKKGEIFSNKNIRSIRPGFGLHPKYYYEILGKPSKRSYNKGDRLEL